MQLIFESIQEINNAESVFGSAHFPDNFVRIFSKNSEDRIVMQKAETPLGNWNNLVFTEPVVAFERSRIQDCSLHYMPGEFLFGIATIRDRPVLLYYDVATEQFYDVLEALGALQFFTATPQKQAIYLEWVNPSASIFDKVIIKRKLLDYPEDLEDGTEIYHGDGTNVKDTGLIMGTRYYYRAFPYDTSGEVNDEPDGQQLDEQPLDILTALYIVHSNNVILEGIKTQ